MDNKKNNNVKRQSFLETYEIKEKIGEGSGGTVIRAYHKNLQKDVVLKKLHDDVSEVLSKRAETDALKNLRHPYIPQVLDFIELDDGIYTVMDFVPGTTFEKLLKQKRQFTQKEVLKYARQLYEVLTYIHTRNPKIIHGDIKPDNLILTPDDNICLIDFNISGIADEGGALIEGFTGAYSAPEQIAVFKKFRNELDKMVQQVGGASLSSGNQNNDYKPTEILQYQATELIVPNGTSDTLKTMDSSGTESIFSTQNKESEISTALKTLRQSNISSLKIDERADIYSAAATLYHILTGKEPKLENGVVIPPNRMKSNISEGLNYILCHALEQAPDKRFSSSADVLKALNEIGKLDSRYKTLTKKQNAQFIVAVALICLGIILINSGNNITKKEIIAKYNDNIAQMEQLVGDASKNDEFERLYAESLDIRESQIDAYLYYALNLFRQRNYEGTIQYITEVILDNDDLINQSGIDSIYYMLGSSYFRMDEPNYEEAVSAYSTAVKLGNDQVSCYRELAEAYLALNQVDKAEKVLEDSKSVGASSEDMLLLTGEIAATKGNTAEAIESYKECIATSSDDEVTLRAYLGWNEAVLMPGKTAETLQEATSVLDKAQTDLPASLQIQVLQSQTQNYIDLFSVTGEEKYAKLGIDTIEKAISSGWGNYTNYLNEAFLYEQLKNFDKAKEILLSLANNYPNYYSIYMRLAFLEADIQNAIAIPSQRDYEEFEEYYHKSRDLYDGIEHQTNDLEMQLLDQMHNDAIQNGWIEN